MKERAKSKFESVQDLVDRIKGLGIVRSRRIAEQNALRIIFGAISDQRPDVDSDSESDDQPLLSLGGETAGDFRLGGWVTIKREQIVKGTYKVTKWGVVDSDGIDDDGYLLVKTAKSDTVFVPERQRIHWTHCNVRRFVRKERVKLRMDPEGLLIAFTFSTPRTRNERCRSANPRFFCQILLLLTAYFIQLIDSGKNKSYFVVRHLSSDPAKVLVVPYNLEDAMSETDPYTEDDEE